MKVKVKQTRTTEIEIDESALEDVKANPTKYVGCYGWTHPDKAEYEVVIDKGENE